MLNKINYQITRKTIPEVEIVSLTAQKWYDWDGQLTNWSGSIYNGPNINDVYYNITGSLSSGYYKWNGVKWIDIQKKDALDDFNLALFLENNADEMGVMVGFDGDIEQLEQIVNFSYTQTGKSVIVYSTVNPDKIRKIVEQNYTINWGDNTTSTLSVNQGNIGTNLPNVTHTYLVSSGYTITVSLDTPWTKQKVSKKIVVPADIIKPNPLGTFTGATVPAYSNLTGQTQDYLNNLDYTNNTGYTVSGFTYLALGKSRISEKKLYGNNTYSGVTYGTDEIGKFSAYTIDNLFYKDYSDGYTTITGTTSGYTREEVFNKLITRDEHFLGFVDEPAIYSDIFVERKKQSVLENNLRLGEIDSVGELDTYQNEYFIIKKE